MKNHLLAYLSIPLDKLSEPKKKFLLLSEFFQWSGKNQGEKATFKNCEVFSNLCFLNRSDYKTTLKISNLLQVKKHF